jgi:hypothetical protein
MTMITPRTQVLVGGQVGWAAGLLAREGFAPPLFAEFVIVVKVALVGFGSPPEPVPVRPADWGEGGIVVVPVFAGPAELEEGAPMVFGVAFGFDDWGGALDPPMLD